jgi:hypothetical protein
MDAQLSHIVHIALLVIEEAHALEWHTCEIATRSRREGARVSSGARASNEQ